MYLVETDYCFHKSTDSHPNCEFLESHILALGEHEVLEKNVIAKQEIELGIGFGGLGLGELHQTWCGLKVES